ncbi:MAG: hypothetical protein PV344_04440, partial [Anaplasma sp.]|nr:hypothetical protein [Anaplasma sp.]
MKLFAGSNFRESNVASIVLTYCPNCSRDVFFANRRRFEKFAKITSSRKLIRLQYLFLFSKWPVFLARLFVSFLLSFVKCAHYKA